ncbi:TraV family lipoprotein [Burkholderia sp. MBR-1]|uniref:TraV family lipoprotein n=1 Tax=Burkholderia sp. MBR-1 TaxID=2732364 RepID=UPI0015EF464F|nr:TraV family lipoprotein [Burkholderia sp. MBR-1]QMI49774.1 TraV family lipoprotein [Burkholderia sp. MBR-1]
MKRKSVARCIAPLLPVLVLSGCGSLWSVGNSKFDCPGIPNGVVCKTPREVYDLTNHHDALVTMDSDGKQTGNAEITVGKPTGVLAQGASVRLPQPIQQPMPILEPARVMRIWVNSWIDQNGDLHYPGLLFTEVTPRRWAQGNLVSGVGAKTLVPVQIDADRNDSDAGTSTITGGGGITPEAGVIPKPQAIIQPYTKPATTNKAPANNQGAEKSSLPLGLPSAAK